MVPETYPCPQCQALLRAVPGLGPGDPVRCPRCHTEFPVPEGGPSPVGIATTTGSAPDPRTVGEESPPLGRRAFREIGEEDSTRAEVDEGPRASRLEGLVDAYTIDLGEWLRHASAHWSAVLGPAIGWLVLVFFIYLVLGFLPIPGLIVELVIVPPLAAGITVVGLRQLRGRAWTFGDFFSGFQWWWPLFANQFLALFLVGACILPFLAILGILHAASPRGPDELGIAVLIGMGILCYCSIVYLGVRAFSFTVPLIIDRGCGPVEAVQGSWAITRGHFWGLFGVGLVLGLINLAGLLMLLVGLLFTVPFTALASTAGYLLITGRSIHAPEDRPSDY